MRGTVLFLNRNRAIVTLLQQFINVVPQRDLGSLVYYIEHNGLAICVLPDELRVGLPLLTKSLLRRFQVLTVAEEIIVQVLIITQDSSQAELGHVSNDPIGVAQ